MQIIPHDASDVCILAKFHDELAIAVHLFPFFGCKTGQNSRHSPIPSGDQNLRLLLIFHDM